MGLADVPLRQKLEWGYIRMFPCTKNWDKGTSMFPFTKKNRNKGTFVTTALLWNRPFVSSRSLGVSHLAPFVSLTNPELSSIKLY